MHITISPRDLRCCPRCGCTGTSTDCDHCLPDAPFLCPRRCPERERWALRLERLDRRLLRANRRAAYADTVCKVLMMQLVVAAPHSWRLAVALGVCGAAALLVHHRLSATALRLDADFARLRRNGWGLLMPVQRVREGSVGEEA